MEYKIDVAVRGIINHNGKVLIIQRSENDETGANTWEFAGGAINFGEDLEEALLREIREETNLSVTVDKLLYAVSFKISEYRQIVFLTYTCSAHDNIVTLSDEHKDYLWADKKQMTDLLSKSIVDSLNHNSIWEHIFP